MEKKRCQGILLTEQHRKWAKTYSRDIRCKHSAKPETNFCGNHAQLGEVISEIVWKNEN